MPVKVKSFLFFIILEKILNSFEQALLGSYKCTQLLSIDYFAKVFQKIIIFENGCLSNKLLIIHYSGKKS